jgi:hypothetical protein
VGADRAERLAALFREAGRAHHQAFLATDGEDPEWPIWYAERLQAPLNAALGVVLSRSEIVHALVAADRAYREQGPAEEWPSFYARAFLSRYGSSPAG